MKFHIFSNLFDSQHVGTTSINEWNVVAVLCCYEKSSSYVPTSLVIWSFQLLVHIIKIFLCFLIQHFKWNVNKEVYTALFSLYVNKYMYVYSSIHCTQEKNLLLCYMYFALFVVVLSGLWNRANLSFINGE